MTISLKRSSLLDAGFEKLGHCVHENQTQFKIGSWWALAKIALWKYESRWRFVKKRLTDCAPRFARGTIGGKEGKFYMVTEPRNDIANPKLGTLCHVVTHRKPMCIFAMVLGLLSSFPQTPLSRPLNPSHSSCQGGMIRDGENHLGLRTTNKGDRGSTAVTISNCHFTDHNDDFVEMMPRFRFGFLHVINNGYIHWFMYAIEGVTPQTRLRRTEGEHQGRRYIRRILPVENGHRDEHEDFIDDVPFHNENPSHHPLPSHRTNTSTATLVDLSEWFTRFE
ncbi:hypothetical protein Gogos_009057 [Gossypium gossypioides]|uniref:Pectate lyase n=1 Tax=Gossypium gossypioides TaxID=34282 RepID=A0A7J9CDK1_GOSGO|nr:hypothetical protein [Gossypium gossypioides]